MRPTGIALALAVALVGHALAEEAPEPIVDDPIRTVDISEASEGGRLIRITRDYNNDGLDDVAIGFEEACGNKTCWFELFLRTRDGRYKHVGGLGGLPFAFRLVPLTVGRARWETCSASSGIVGFSSLVISMEGIAEEPGRTLSEAETETLCRWPGQYTWEVCDVAQLRSTGACSWVRRSWP